MLKLKLLTVASIALLCLSQAAMAEVKIGDDAPAFTPGKFLKGEAVDKLEKGKIYVVEFWATWCGPCKQSIPHLTDMQKNNKDVTFIGMDCWEENQDGVQKFVDDMGDKMNYRVALDTAPGNDGKMSKAWMEAAGQNGIPTAFIIDKESHIAWIGHPMEMGDVLPKVIDGTFDSKKFAEAQKVKHDAEEKLQAALEGKKWDDALSIIDGMIKDIPDDKSDLTTLKFQVIMEKGDWKTIAAMSEDILKTLGDNADSLNEIAWRICESESKDKDLGIALKFATKANDLEKGNNPTILDTLALVYFSQGNMDKALETQKLAVDKLKDNKDIPEEAKKEITDNLTKYEEAKKGK